MASIWHRAGASLGAPTSLLTPGRNRRRIVIPLRRQRQQPRPRGKSPSRSSSRARDTRRVRLHSTRRKNQMTRKALHTAVALALAGGVLVIPQAYARITKLEISSRTTAFGGYAFANVGQYERIVGVAHGELDPND